MRRQPVWLRDNSGRLRVLLISTYDLGHQPFGLASPAAWLRAAGHTVETADLAVTALPVPAVTRAELIAFYLPMHTATRLALKLMPRVRALNGTAHLCCYGLYAPMNERHLRECGVATVLGGEYEQSLVELAARLALGQHGIQREPLVSLGRQQFLVPDRSGMPDLSGYGRIVGAGTAKRVGYTEASRGCKHLCRHCPIVPVYNGAFRVVQREVVREDIRRQVAAGAEHVTFGDPDFFNAPLHALAIVEALHAEFPALTYDVTIKIEHLLKHRELLAPLKRTGCLFVTSAVESVDDAVLEKLAKGHTREDFLEAVRLMRAHELALAPTFVAFTPWTTRESYVDLLNLLAGLDLVDAVAPIQLALRLLIPEGSRLLELPEVARLVGPFDRALLCYPWRHPDPAMDALTARLQELVQREDRKGSSRREVFAKIWEVVAGRRLPPDFHLVARAAIPYMDEPWYC
jgi:radical SAM superfamily enzyme YgiQ (UPF0313 family)